MLRKASLTALFVVVLQTFSQAQDSPESPNLRIGIIGLDTSHVIHFTRIINESDNPVFAGAQVIAAYPNGSPDIPSSLKRIPEYTQKLKSVGVEIVPSIAMLLEKVDAVLLETNDGRPHLEQVIPVFQAAKPVFIDKPVAGSLVDALAIYQLAEHYDVPVFTSSSLRYTEGAQKILAGAAGDVLGCEAYSPCPLEPTHPDLYWYGIHGVETLFTMMGPGCTEVVRMNSEMADVVVGHWNDGRLGTFRGRRGKDGKYRGGYGGTVFGTKGVKQIGGHSGYDPLLVEVIKFFRSGKSPVSAEESLQIYTFMTAADESKRLGGIPVSMQQVHEQAEAKIPQRLQELGIHLTGTKPSGLRIVPGPFSKSDETRNTESNIVWLRCYAKVPAKWTTTTGRRLYAESVYLTVDHFAEAYEVYVNGQKIAQAGQFSPNYEASGEQTKRHKISPGILKKDRYNVIAFRVELTDSLGGFKGRAPVLGGYFLESVLEGEWESLDRDDPSFAILSQLKRPAQSLFEEFREASSPLGIPKTFSPGRKLSPEESLSRMTTMDGLDVDLILSEPEIAQPLQMSFDDRGRLWVVEYRQYPYPEGVKMVSRDRYYRAVYDQVPPAPPNHTPGADRISIHEDTDGDGTFESHKTFVDGLNLTTAVAHGYGGVWVMHPPYLLFYPDHNKDDIPDSDPTVHLSGFGLEDTHSVANSLTFGPDGWLYGAQGSTVSSHVKVHHQSHPSENPVTHYCEGAAVWRYHPKRHLFEFFAHGGGNAFGLEFDAQGRVYSGHNGGKTRGFHYVQGGHYLKGSTHKFGPMHNPYLFGYLPWMDHAPVPRFSHDLIKYESPAMPDRFQGKLFSVDPLHQNIVMSEMETWGSSFRTKDVGYPLESDDLAFRPVHIESGPDGMIYIADFCEEFIAHGQHFQGQIDKNSGRIYRLRPTGKAVSASMKIGKSARELLQTLTSDNKRVRQLALRKIADEKRTDLLPELEKVFLQPSRRSLDALWAINQLAGLNQARIKAGLHHPIAEVRMWTVRLMTDDRKLSEQELALLITLAQQEPAAEVRSQLASSAQRIDVEQAIKLIDPLTAHDEDAEDPFLALQLWWAMELVISESPELVMDFYRTPASWQRKLVRQSIAAHTMKRFAKSATRQDLLRCAELLELAPDENFVDELVSLFEVSLPKQAVSNIPLELADALTKLGGGSLVLQIRLKNSEAIEQGLSVVEEQASEDNTHDVMMALAELRHSGLFQWISQQIQSLSRKTTVSESEVSLLKSMVTALQYYNQEQIAEILLPILKIENADLRERVVSLLASRETYALKLVRAIDDNLLDESLIPQVVIRQLAIYENEQIQKILHARWPDLNQVSLKNVASEIAHYQDIIKVGEGNPYTGRKLFEQKCSKCHILYGEGGKIGPDLTPYQRDDLSRMLLSILSPSAEIREGFESYLVITTGGLVATGFLIDQDTHIVSLRGVDGTTVRVAREEIDLIEKQGQSLMPVGLLKDLDDQQVRDFWAYLRTGQPIQ